MEKKKWIFLFLAFAMMVVLSGCGKENNTQAKTASVPGIEEQITEMTQTLFHVTDQYRNVDFSSYATSLYLAKTNSSYQENLKLSKTMDENDEIKATNIQIKEILLNGDTATVYLDVSLEKRINGTTNRDKKEWRILVEKEGDLWKLASERMETTKAFAEAEDSNMIEQPLKEGGSPLPIGDGSTISIDDLFDQMRIEYQPPKEPEPSMAPSITKQSSEQKTVVKATVAPAAKPVDEPMVKPVDQPTQKPEETPTLKLADQQTINPENPASTQPDQSQQENVHFSLSFSGVSLGESQEDVAKKLGKPDEVNQGSGVTWKYRGKADIYFYQDKVEEITIYKQGKKSDKELVVTYNGKNLNTSSVNQLVEWIGNPLSGNLNSDVLDYGNLVIRQSGGKINYFEVYDMGKSQTVQTREGLKTGQSIQSAVKLYGIPNKEVIGRSVNGEPNTFVTYLFKNGMMIIQADKNGKILAFYMKPGP
ncbi:hypothetical protein L1765_08680 [Microaerobacter geothermalis]|uniref:hypothetical protein n=1 Tax=Microaerobacter geothermalis TaxID=674972 RepID=UPI001F29EA1D|nr:hypothetical protein [Microaerobacter geothermalis]MCF6094042.1 hypothetical protein [Microaerobacter geothermalis]